MQLYISSNLYSLSTLDWELENYSHTCCTYEHVGASGSDVYGKMHPLLTPIIEQINNVQTLKDPYTQ